MSTLVVYSDTTDGYIGSADVGASPSYAAARAGTGSVLDAYAGIELTFGQQFTTSGDPDYIPDYDIYESFLAFNTSSIPDTDTVSAAVLNLRSLYDHSTTDFTIEARLYDWGTGLTTADYVAGASLSALTLLAHRDTASGWTVNTAYDLTDDAFAANVSKTGTTRLLLCSSRTTGNNTPTTYEQGSAYSADQTGTTSDPKLTVTYSSSYDPNVPGATQAMMGMV